MHALAQSAIAQTWNGDMEKPMVLKVALAWRCGHRHGLSCGTWQYAALNPRPSPDGRTEIQTKTIGFQSYFPICKIPAKKNTGIQSYRFGPITFSD